MEHDGTRQEALGRAECLMLLRSVPIGRVVYTDRALPAVRPVAFVLDGDRAVVVRTAPGSKFDAALRGAVVAFEADAIDPAGLTGWTVTAVGRAQAVTAGPEAERLAALPLRPWLPGPLDGFIRIVFRSVAGRRLVSRGAPAAAGPLSLQEG
ncbi:pyridoxamine 5'-phosphate oxidase family protein [Spirillospora albida]|uniref:pyridoxamine 5'-phosphate oxidase family protein n=1 Tax=Spirillospora albida TaxID=58123 RepID=UPI00068F0ABC|nr:pyridoxamine 5'-phosphate oxidase family protein [Spirillospora albida]